MYFGEVDKIPFFKTKCYEMLHYISHISMGDNTSDITKGIALRKHLEELKH